MDNVLKHQAMLADVGKAPTTRDHCNFVTGVRQLSSIERADDASAVD
jgi:hypothetical protein